MRGLVWDQEYPYNKNNDTGDPGFKFRTLGSVITVPIAEELLFRGYLLARFARSEIVLEGRIVFSWVALILSSALFGLLHANWAEDRINATDKTPIELADGVVDPFHRVTGRNDFNQRAVS